MLMICVLLPWHQKHKVGPCDWWSLLWDGDQSVVVGRLQIESALFKDTYIVTEIYFDAIYLSCLIASGTNPLLAK